MENLIRTNQQ